MKRNIISITNAWLLLISMACTVSAIGQQNATYSSNTSKILSTKKNSEMTSLTTYLLFNGTCLQAMQFYESCIGGELTFTKVGDSPMKSYFPESMHQKIVNARLVGEGIDISASDWLRPDETPIKGNTVCLYLRVERPDQLKIIFNKLADGADVTDPLQQKPFGLYGALNDKFGNRWMFLSDGKE